MKENEQTLLESHFFRIHKKDVFIYKYNDIRKAEETRYIILYSVGKFSNPSIITKEMVVRIEDAQFHLLRYGVRDLEFLSKLHILNREKGNKLHHLFKLFSTIKEDLE